MTLAQQIEAQGARLALAACDARRAYLTAHKNTVATRQRFGNNPLHPVVLRAEEAERTAAREKDDAEAVWLVWLEKVSRMAAHTTADYKRLYLADALPDAATELPPLPEAEPVPYAPAA